jgi:hypothetical protein
MKVSFPSAASHKTGMFELPDFEEAFNFEDLQRYYDRQPSSISEYNANSSDDLDLFIVDNYHAQLQDLKDISANFSPIDLDRTRPSTPVDRNPGQSKQEPILKLLEAKTLIPDQSEMIGEYDNTDLSYLTGYWQCVEQECNTVVQTSCPQKVDANDNECDATLKPEIIALEKSDVELHETTPAPEEKPLAKEKKLIFTIIRNNKVKKINEEPVIKKDKKSKKIHKTKKDNSHINPAKTKSVNSVTIYKDKINNNNTKAKKEERKKLKNIALVAAASSSTIEKQISNNSMGEEQGKGKRKKIKKEFF